MLGVNGESRFWSWYAYVQVMGTSEEVNKDIPHQDWLRLSTGAERTGPRRFNWDYLKLASIRLDALDAALDPSWTRGLPVRRSLSDAALVDLITWCPTSTPVESLAMVEGRRGAIAVTFEAVKTEIGLAHK